MTIYLDSDYKCHTTDTGGLTAVETDEFSGKCSAYIEGYRYVPRGETWTREDGEAFAGEMISPWVDWEILNAVQQMYERDQQIAALQVQNADMAAALAVLEVSA